MNEQIEKKHTSFESEKTLALLREIEANPNLTQRYLSQKYKISLGKVNFLISALLEKGIIKANRFKNSKKKGAYAYLLTPAGIKMRLSLTQKFLARKLEEYEALKEEISLLACKSKVPDMTGCLEKITQKPNN